MKFLKFLASGNPVYHHFTLFRNTQHEIYYEIHYHNSFTIAVLVFELFYNFSFSLLFFYHNFSLQFYSFPILVLPIVMHFQFCLYYLTTIVYTVTDLLQQFYNNSFIITILIYRYKFTITNLP